jgi:acyl carrier protein
MKESKSKDIESRVRNFIAENLLYSSDGYPHSDETSFLESGVVDSMGIMELVMFIEKDFSIEIEDYEVIPDNFDSVSNVGSYVRRKLTSGS